MDVHKMYAEGMTITAISRKLGLDRRTVSKALKNKGGPRYKPRTKSPSILEPFKPYIQKRLEDYDLSAVRLLEEIEDQGYTGKYTIVKNYVRSLKKDRGTDAVYRFETPPGEQAQVDWGEFDQVMIDGEIKKLYCFSYMLGYSRERYVEFTFSIDTQTFIQCHLNAFAFLGGYARTTLYDNLKQVVLTKNPKTGQPKYNPLFEDFARHYGFKIRLCRAYRPQTKGKIENNIKFIRGNFYEGREFTGIYDINNQARSWCKKVGDRIHGTTHERPCDRMKHEGLMQISDRPSFVIETQTTRKVSRECLISYMGSKYSVPWKYAGKHVVVKERGEAIRVLFGDQEIAQHRLANAPHCLVRNPDHFAGLLKSLKQNEAPKKKRVLDWETAPSVAKRNLKDYDAMIEEFGGVEDV